MEGTHQHQSVGKRWFFRYDDLPKKQKDASCMNYPLDETPGNLDRDSDMRNQSYTDEARFSGKGKGKITRVPTLKAKTVLDKIKANSSGMSPLLTDRIQTQELLGGEVAG